MTTLLSRPVPHVTEDARAAAMLSRHWKSEFRRLYGADFPVTYCCVDTETSGFDVGCDLILEFGHCLVRDRKVVDRLSLVVDWSGHDVVPDRWVRERLAGLARKMSLDGRPWRLTYDFMKANGVKPDKALRFVKDFLAQLEGSGTLLVSHNGYSFDEKMIRANIEGFLGEEWPGFGADSMFDTGALVKASQCPDHPAVIPRRGDTLESYFRRVVDTRMPGVKWSLDRYCVGAFDLVKKYGVDPSACHSADYDAYLVHLLMEEIRAAFEDDGPRPPAGGGDPYSVDAIAARAEELYGPYPSRRCGQRNC